MLRFLWLKLNILNIKYDISSCLWVILMNLVNLNVIFVVIFENYIYIEVCMIIWYIYIEFK